MLPKLFLCFYMLIHVPIENNVHCIYMHMCFLHKCCITIQLFYNLTFSFINMCWEFIHILTDPDLFCFFCVKNLSQLSDSLLSVS